MNRQSAMTAAAASRKKIREKHHKKTIQFKAVVRLDPLRTFNSNQTKSNQQ